MPVSQNLALVSVSVCLFMAGASYAQDALYPAPPPQDAVFVRWLGEPLPDRDHFMFKGLDFPHALTRTPSYTAVSAALLDDAVPGTFFSVLSVLGQPPRTIAEPSRGDRSKVHLLLISCEREPVALEVPGNGTTVIEPVAAFHADSRAVNPVSTPLEVRNTQSGEVLASFDVQLNRGRNLTFLACGGTAELIDHRFDGSLSAG